MAECAYRTRQLADTHVLRRGIKTDQVALDLRIPVQQFQPEGRRLGVDAMSTANRRRVLELKRTTLQYLSQPDDTLAQQPGSSLYLEGLRRVHHIV